MKYIFVLEESENGFSAYVPDLPGCVAAGSTLEETEALIREAIIQHVELLREYGEPMPEPGTRTGEVEVMTNGHRNPMDMRGREVRLSN